MTYIPTRAAKLDWDVVEKIRRLYEQDGWTQGRLAREFGIGSAQIGRIVRYESWQQTQQPQQPNMEGSIALVQRLLDQAQAEHDANKQADASLKELESKQ